MDILITEPFSDAPALDRLAEKYAVERDGALWQDPPRLCERLREARAIIVRNQTRLTAELLAAAPNLQVIGRNGVGLDNIDMEAAGRTGIVVISPLEANAVTVAELTMGLLLAVARKIPLADHSTRAGGWERLRFMGVELAGKTIVICGFGRIGRRVAKMARGFDMRVVAFDPYLRSDSPALSEAGAALCADLAEALARADFVTVHLPLTPQTRHMFNERAFASAKRGAFFINTSRGGVVDEGALLSALQSGHLGGAALDVREVEPPAMRLGFEDLENVVLTPHIAAFTHEAQTRTIEAVAADVDRVLQGQPALNAVNFPSPRR